MENICTHISRKMSFGELPKVKYGYVLREGLPEEETIAYSKECHPTLIVMGARGKSQKDMDLIGSVTGEVIEVNRVPVLAMPENAPLTDLRDTKNIIFTTLSDQRDLVASDEFMEIIRGSDLNIHLLNISANNDEWDEIRLTGVCEYFKKRCPHAHISYTVLVDGDLLLAIEKFVRDKQVNVIAPSTCRRNILTRMFNPLITRKVLFHTDTSLLATDSKK